MTSMTVISHSSKDVMFVKPLSHFECATWTLDHQVQTVEIITFDDEYSDSPSHAYSISSSLTVAISKDRGDHTSENAVPIHGIFRFCSEEVTGKMLPSAVKNFLSDPTNPFETTSYPPQIDIDIGWCGEIEKEKEKEICGD